MNIFFYDNYDREPATTMQGDKQTIMFKQTTMTEKCATWMSRETRFVLSRIVCSTDGWSSKSTFSNCPWRTSSKATIRCRHPLKSVVEHRYVSFCSWIDKLCRSTNDFLSSSNSWWHVFWRRRMTECGDYKIWKGRYRRSVDHKNSTYYLYSSRHTCPEWRLLVKWS